MALGAAPLSARQLPSDPAAFAGSDAYTRVVDSYQASDGATIALTIVSKPGAAGRAGDIAEEAKLTLKLLDDWLGPPGSAPLAIVDAPWTAPSGTSTAGRSLTVRSRLFDPVRDRSLEREVIAGLARQYWRHVGGMFGEGLALYTAGRAIDTRLEGSQFHTDRYFGGFLPFPIRSIELSPRPRDARPRLRRYDELESADPQASRAARALEVAERYLGWPVMQQALSAFRASGKGGLADFVAIASEQRGRDLAWLFTDAMREAAVFDYAVDGVDNTASGDRFEVRVTIARRGDAVFAGALPVETWFADGASLRELWDGGQQRSSIEYVSRSPAVAAAIDPDVILVLDQQRANNVVRLAPQPWNRLAIRLACNWAIWLQQAMLTYSGIA
jgi:hypothetical protein